MSEKPKSTPEAKSGSRTPWEIREALFDSSLSPEARLKEVFGGEEPPKAEALKAPELDPKLKERLERAMGTMYNQLGRIHAVGGNRFEKESEFFPSSRIGEYKMRGETFHESRHVDFTKEKKVLRFEFQSPTMITLWFDNKAIAYYDFSPDLPPGFRECHNAELLVEKLEKFSALLDSNTESDLQDSMEEAKNF